MGLVHYCRAILMDSRLKHRREPNCPFATMFVQSNDLFYAPSEDGIALWDDAGNRISGDVTDQIMLWDSGTEENQAIGMGADQAPRQSGANTGAADEDNTVRIVMGDGHSRSCQRRSRNDHAVRRFCHGFWRAD